jgi:hypothetical protein
MEMGRKCFISKPGPGFEARGPGEKIISLVPRTSILEPLRRKC